MKLEWLRLLIADRSGVSTIEMGLICAMIGLAMFGALQGFSNESKLTWTTISNQVQAASTQANGG